jgi:hypothetical protein
VVELGNSFVGYFFDVSLHGFGGSIGFGEHPHIPTPALYSYIFLAIFA